MFGEAGVVVFGEPTINVKCNKNPTKEQILDNKYHLAIDTRKY